METTKTTTTTLEQAIQTVYASRQNRTSHPNGEFDNAGRWYPRQKR